MCLRICSDSLLFKNQSVLVKSQQLFTGLSQVVHSAFLSTARLAHFSVAWPTSELTFALFQHSLFSSSSLNPPHDPESRVIFGAAGTSWVPLFQLCAQHSVQLVVVKTILVVRYFAYQSYYCAFKCSFYPLTLQIKVPPTSSMSTAITAN